MGYEEYLDLIEKAQKNGKYIIFSLDGEHASRKDKYRLFCEKSIALMFEMKDIFLKMENKDEILVRDDNMIVNDYKMHQAMIWPKSWNPFFTNGDLIAFYFYSNKMDKDTFKKVFMEAAKKVDNNFKYHLSSLKYDTNNRLESNSLLWAGYALQYINDNKLIRNEILEIKNNKR